MDDDRVEVDLGDAIGVIGGKVRQRDHQLRQSGLVEESHPEFDARVRVYALRSGPIAELKDWLSQTEQMWSDQLLSLKAHLER